MHPLLGVRQVCPKPLMIALGAETLDRPVYVVWIGSSVDTPGDTRFGTH